ncbi:MAG TPA: deoxyhypusine synthase [Pyrodictium delaneyi]|uniref:Deoxyhypusine synthase n=1 Tax=Pyrodictium delaneyi TaxID=1273541 RepID=A0A832ZV00_9CREN|nr:deoxyhypusine synthase [Pyrodictium delaneyi]
MEVERSKLLVEPVRDVEIDPDKPLASLIDMLDSIHGFMAGHVVRAVRLLSRCLRKSDLRVISFTANLVATGLRGVFAQLIRENLFNLVVTTCGAIDHDIARGSGGAYYKGFFETDDRMLHDLEVHRLGNVFIPMEDYGPRVERTVYSILDRLDRSREWAIYEILWEIGKELRSDNGSILAAAAETGTPLIVPGFLDGAFGTALFTYLQTHRDLRVNAFRDEEVMSNKFFTAKHATALIIGGGISKHHAIWWAQFREGFDCAVYVTTAVEYDGSLSGAHPREAITWNKLRPEGESVVVYGDATVVLPIIVAGVLAEYRKKNAKNKNDG